MGKKIDDGKLQRRFNLISTIDSILFMYIKRALPVLLVCLFIWYFPPTRNVTSKHAGKDLRIFQEQGDIKRGIALNAIHRRGHAQVSNVLELT